ncbi:uncharacterized protein LOC123553389 [Mercenaria mercenaria]|uniref:uncharacterized protein LOC123553389 n=1 Tax=Mercenaria mercenaria TaxID=6596 RepID=UPI00234F8366|nr:uncharacterized protein LOC123553389 [Mercenaria mercenaria]
MSEFKSRLAGLGAVSHSGRATFLFGESEAGEWFWVPAGPQRNTFMSLVIFTQAMIVESPGDVFSTMEHQERRGLRRQNQEHRTMELYLWYMYKKRFNKPNKSEAIVTTKRNTIRTIRSRTGDT